MKRLNPETGKPFVRGDARADGFLFLQYKTRLLLNGFFAEGWVSPKVFESIYSKSKNLTKVWRLNNTNKVKRTHKKWRKNHPDKLTAKTAKRRASKLQRTPPWLTQEHLQQIESVYALAKQLTADTGVAHHVDHIVPLRGELVSGLHVPWNLRAVPAAENQSKSNKW